MQLCNVKHPNSQKNTCLVSMFMAGDSTTNLHTSLDMYQEHIRELQGMELGLVTYVHHSNTVMPHLNQLIVEGR